MRPLLEFLRAEDGPAAVEYAVMLALILIVAVSAIGGFGNGTGGLFAGIVDELRGAGFF